MLPLVLSYVWLNYLRSPFSLVIDSFVCTFFYDDLPLFRWLNSLLPDSRTCYPTCLIPSVPFEESRPVNSFFLLVCLLSTSDFFVIHVLNPTKVLPLIGFSTTWVIRVTDVMVFTSKSKKKKYGLSDLYYWIFW